MDSFDLADVIALNESSGVLAAAKFEEHTYTSMSDGGLGWTLPARQIIAKRHDCDAVTARAIASTSWGLFQIMGFNLWDPTVCSWTLDLGAFLVSRDAQYQAFRDFLRTQKIDYTLSDILNDPAKRTHFITVYNGPGDVENYLALTLRSIATLRARQGGDIDSDNPPASSPAADPASA